jgi:hypothetical protein
MDATQAKTQKKETPPSQIPQRSVAMHLQEAKLRSGRRAFAMTVRQLTTAWSRRWTKRPPA